MKFNEDDLDQQIKKTKLEILKLVGGLLSGVMIVSVLGVIYVLGRAVVAILG